MRAFLAVFAAAASMAAAQWPPTNTFNIEWFTSTNGYCTTGGTNYTYVLNNCYDAPDGHPYSIKFTSGGTWPWYDVAYYRDTGCQDHDHIVYQGSDGCGNCITGWHNPQDGNQWEWPDYIITCPPTQAPPPPPPTHTLPPVGPGKVVNITAYPLSNSGQCSSFSVNVQTNFDKCFNPSPTGQGPPVKFTYISDTQFNITYYNDPFCLGVKAVDSHPFNVCFNDKAFGWLMPFPDLSVGFYNNN